MSPEPSPSPSRPPSPGGSYRSTAVVVAAALLAGAVAGGVWALTRDDDSGNRDASGGTTPSVTVTATAPPSDDTGAPQDTLGGSESPLASAYASPSPGFSRSVDGLGFTVDVPEGWTRTVDPRGDKPPVVHYTAPGGDAELEMFELQEPSPADSLDQAENDPSFGFGTRLHGYQAVDREAGTDWAELTYRYDDVEDGPTEVVDHRFTAADGTSYAIRSIGAEGTDVATPSQIAVGSFCPSGAACTVQ
ncbi:hypothetical protein ACFV6E_23195 [Streptomyces sp. NPDC059785]|uniref:hypothetical protein n=1 Tax=Streptomyces sp. NPDC059785 TaxID=3346945 RepID=UPI003648C886